MFVTLMPCLYVVLCGPKIRNKDSCILYLGNIHFTLKSILLVDFNLKLQSEIANLLDSSSFLL